jgi:tryptophan-rich sensory protein
MSIIRLSISILLVQLTGFFGSLFNNSKSFIWYFGLTKPELTPPNWLFPIVWIILYFLIGISLFMIWRLNENITFKRNILIIFSIHLLLNILWSFIFFGLNQILFSVIIIIILWFVIFINIMQISKVSAIASALLIPYLLWVSFAIYLNISIYILN